MSLSLETAQTLIVGAFNPHIVHPVWLTSQSICANKDEEIKMRVLPLHQGLSFDLGSAHWQIDFRSLLIQSRTANCGELASRVLELLPHTPVQAVGNNFHYACGKDEWAESPIPMLGEKAIAGSEEMGQVEQTRWGCVFRTEEVRTEVTLAYEDAGVVVLFNFHRETKRTEEAGQAADRFEADRQTSIDLVGRLFNQEVTL